MNKTVSYDKMSLGRMVKSVYTQHLKCCGRIARAGSSPALATAKREGFPRLESGLVPINSSLSGDPLPRHNVRNCFAISTLLGRVDFREIYYVPH